MRYGAVMDAADYGATRDQMLRDLRNLDGNNTVFVFEEIDGVEISEDIRIHSGDPRRYSIEVAGVELTSGDPEGILRAAEHIVEKRVERRRLSSEISKLRAEFEEYERRISALEYRRSLPEVSSDEFAARHFRD